MGGREHLEGCPDSRYEHGASKDTSSPLVRATRLGQGSKLFLDQAAIPTRPFRARNLSSSGGQVNPAAASSDGTRRDRQRVRVCAVRGGPSTCTHAPAMADHESGMLVSRGRAQGGGLRPNCTGPSNRSPGGGGTATHNGHVGGRDLYLARSQAGRCPCPGEFEPGGGSPGGASESAERLPLIAPKCRRLIRKVALGRMESAHWIGGGKHPTSPRKSRGAHRRPHPVDGAGAEPGGDVRRRFETPRAPLSGEASLWGCQLLDHGGWPRAARRSTGKGPTATVETAISAGGDRMGHLLGPHAGGRRARPGRPPGPPPGTTEGRPGTAGDMVASRLNEPCRGYPWGRSVRSGGGRPACPISMTYPARTGSRLRGLSGDGRTAPHAGESCHGRPGAGRACAAPGLRVRPTPHFQNAPISSARTGWWLSSIDFPPAKGPEPWRTAWSCGGPTGASEEPTWC